MNTNEQQTGAIAAPVDAKPATIRTEKTHSQARRMAREPAVEAERGIGKIPPASTPSSKASLVLSLMRQSQGATLIDMVVVTGWLPHTARAVLSGLRKKGRPITKAKQDGVTRYSIAGDAQ